MENIVRYLPSNYIASTIRLLDKAAAREFRQYVSTRLSLPSPPHAFKARWGVQGSVRSMMLQQRHLLLVLTATSGIVDNLRVALEVAECVLVSELMHAAAAAGQLDMCQWLRGQGVPWGKALSSAARAGQLVACDWLLTNGCPWTEEAVYDAARGGHVGLMEWLMSQSPSKYQSYKMNESRLLAAAAEGCELETLKRLHREYVQGSGGGQQRPPVRLDDNHKARILVAAASSPTADWQDKMEWLESLRCPRTGTPCEAAAATPNALSHLVWLHQRAYPMEKITVATAAANGNVAALDFLLAEVRVRAGGEAAIDAARNGHLEVLRYLHTRRCPVLRHEVLEAAAGAGHMAVVVWVVETLGMIVSKHEGLLKTAAQGGSVEMLSWLRARGCEWGRGVFACVASDASEELLEYMAANGCSFENDSRPYHAAACSGNLAALRCLARLGCPWGAPGAVFTRCIWGICDLPVLRCLLDAGCPVCWEEALEAARQHDGEDRDERLAWLEGERRRRHKEQPSVPGEGCSGSSA